MSLQLEDYDLLPSEDATPVGAPMQIAVSAVEEDPEQPRQEFDAEALEELAATIRERGVRQPISVRPHPDHPGRWMLNFGARRLRASKLAGRSHVPAFVDNAIDGYDQVIENEQRQGLKPLELALFVKKRLASGETQAEVARRLGKSPALITMIRAMIDPPDWLMDAYRSGRCRGIAELYELRRLHEAEPHRAVEIVTQGLPITRATMQAIRAMPRHPMDRDRANTAAAPVTIAAEASVATPQPALPVVSPRAGQSAQRLDARAEAHCSALEAIVDLMKVCEPGLLILLRRRLAALAER